MTIFHKTSICVLSNSQCSAFIFILTVIALLLPIIIINQFSYQGPRGAIAAASDPDPFLPALGAVVGGRGQQRRPLVVRRRRRRRRSRHRHGQQRQCVKAAAGQAGKDVLSELDELGFPALLVNDAHRDNV